MVCVQNRLWGALVVVMLDWVIWNVRVMIEVGAGFF
jgi:hypothetical protein